jgi:quercetin dioxygenase-like cupin family protein
MIKLPLFSQQSGPAVQTLLELPGLPHAGLQVGSVKLQPNERVPAEGLSQHAVDEVSLIVKGSLTGESGGETFTVAAGDVTLIPAGEPHWAVAGPDGAEILWMWFGDLTAEK